MTVAAQSGSQKLGVVNGEVVSEEEVREAAAHDLGELEVKRLQAEAKYQQDKHDILQKTLDGLIEDKLLQAEADKRKISLEELVETEIEKNFRSAVNRRFRRSGHTWWTCAEMKFAKCLSAS